MAREKNLTARPLYVSSLIPAEGRSRRRWTRRNVCRSQATASRVTSISPSPLPPRSRTIEGDAVRRVAVSLLLLFLCSCAPTVPLFLYCSLAQRLRHDCPAPLCPNPPRINNSRWPTRWPITFLVINTWLLPLVRKVDLTSSPFSAFKQLLSVGVLTQRKMDPDRETNVVEIPRLNIQWDWKEALKCVGYIPVNSKTVHLPSGHSPGIWLEFCSVQWRIWPK